MSDERMIRALGRLEQALLRAEAAGGQVEESAAAAAVARESLQENLARLKARHERLRESAAGAVTQLDGLIASSPVEAHGG
jgi:adenylosuccinate lyase